MPIFIPGKCSCCLQHLSPDETTLSKLIFNRKLLFNESVLYGKCLVFIDLGGFGDFFFSIRKPEALNPLKVSGLFYLVSRGNTSLPSTLVFISVQIISRHSLLLFPIIFVTFSVSGCLCVVYRVW